MSKRPLGLSKSKGKGSTAPTSKKQKIAHEEEDPQSLDDWDDLQELFARANATFIKGDMPGALPLLRGVAHECDRIQRNASEGELNRLTALEAPSARCTNSHSSFFSLYADALLHMGLIIGREPELIVEGEPDSAESYFKAATALLDERWPNKQQIDDVRLQFTWANLLLLLADVALSIMEDGYDEADDEIRGHIEDALVRYSISVKLASPFEPVAASTPAQPVDGGDEQHACLPTLTLARIHAAIGSRLWEVVERLPPSVREPWLGSVLHAFTFAIEKSHTPDEDDALYAGLVGRGGVKLAEIGEVLPNDADGQNDDQDPSNEHDTDTDATRNTLDTCIKHFEEAQKVAKRCSPRTDIVIAPEASNIKNLLEEALIYRANIAKDEADREMWFAFAHSVGINLDDEGEGSGNDD